MGQQNTKGVDKRLYDDKTREDLVRKATISMTSMLAFLLCQSFSRNVVYIDQKRRVQAKGTQSRPAVAADVDQCLALLQGFLKSFKVLATADGNIQSILEQLQASESHLVKIVSRGGAKEVCYCYVV